MEALIVVDVQNDFCPGGTLAVPEGDEIMGAVNRLATDAPLVIATRDWHPVDHASFAPPGRSLAGALRARHAGRAASSRSPREDGRHHRQGSGPRARGLLGLRRRRSPGGDPCVNVEPGDDERAVAELRAAGVKVR